MIVRTKRIQQGGLGLFIGVVGPSGAGKDSVLRGAQQRLALHPHYHFARRIITRPPEPNEDHQPLSPRLFERGIAQQDFALWWQAHECHYGLAAELKDDVANGRIVIANISRSAVADALTVFGACLTVHITARPEVLAQRLGARGRETHEQQEVRLLRSRHYDPETRFDVTIDNSGYLSESIDRFVAVLKAASERLLTDA